MRKYFSLFYLFLDDSTQTLKLTMREKCRLATAVESAAIEHATKTATTTDTAMMVLVNV